MSERRLYVEGGGNSKELRTRCREGFRKLLEKSGFAGRVPRIVASGSRNEAYDDFKNALASRQYKEVLLILDSEDPVANIEQTWAHLGSRDKWDCPPGAADEQVFLMTTCMETWIVADRNALRQEYKDCLQDSALPSLVNIERRDRHIEIQDKLVHATRDCTNAYVKNKRSFKALENVDPKEVAKHCPSFARMIRILTRKL